MRVFALLCGLAASFLVILAPTWLNNDILQSFLALWPAGESQRSTALLAWYAIPAAALVGGILALLAPGFAAIFLLGAAAAWATIGLYLPGIFDFPLLVPPVLAGVGAVVAFLAGELQVSQQRAVRRQRRAMQSSPSNDAEAEAREEAFRMDPQVTLRNFSPARPVVSIPFDIAEREPFPVQQSPRTIVQAARAAALREDQALQVDRQLETSRPRNGALVPWLVAINGVALAGLVVAIGMLLLSNEQVAAWLEQTGVPASETVTEVAALTPPGASAQTPIGPLVQPDAMAADLPMVGPAAPAALVGPDVARVADADGAYADPFAYCGAVGTVDYIDRRYTGPGLTPDIADALHVPMNSAPDRVNWRCVDGKVYACASFDWPICAMTPTANEMSEFCKRNPNVPRLLAPSGTWLCEDGRASLPEGVNWPTDARGFYPAGWILVDARAAAQVAG